MESIVMFMHAPSQRRRTGLVCARLGGWLAAAWLASLTPLLAAEGLPLPYREAFAQAPLADAWTVDVSTGNRIEVAEGALQIHAADNTYAHLQRPLGVDLVRAAATLQPRGGISWVCSLFLYWDARNWCQVSVLEHEPNYYAVQLLDGQLFEQRRALPAKADAYRLAIALGEDVVRFQASDDGQAWKTWLVAERPASWKGRPPALVIVGKGFSRDEEGQPYTAPDLDNDYADRGTVKLSRVRDLAVESLPAAELRLTAQEKRELEAVGRDVLGEAELAADTDPSFASVCRHFPPMKHPRESLGVPDGPDEIVVLPEATLEFGGVKAAFRIGAPPVPFGGAGVTRRLHEGYLPIVITAQPRDGLELEQTVLGWSPELSPDTPLYGLVRLRLANPGATARSVAVEFAAPEPVATWTLEVPAGGARSVAVRVPFAQPAGVRILEAAEFERRLSETADFWRALLAKGIKLRLPEPRLNDAYRAWLAYNFINVDKRGSVYEPHDGGGGFYEEVYGYSASRYCYALDLMGYPNEARRYLDSILTFVTPEGLLAVNYGLPDLGTQLWAMSQHFRITGDAAWLRRVAPTMIKMGDWVIRTRASSMAQQSPDAAWYGLIKYRPYCDEPTPTYSYHTDTYLALGLRETAEVLRAIGQTEAADRFAQESAAYQRDILRSMDRATIERQGMKMLPVFPETHALLKRVGYTGADYYSLVGSMVLEPGLLAANDPRARRITDLMERKNGLCLGTCGFQNGIDHAYTYGYWMHYLERDEAKRVILGLYTSLAYGMTRDTYSGVEVTFLRTGENAPTLPHLYSGTQQLLLLRNLLLWERDDVLWLGRAVPRPWLADGQEIEVRDAPTRFGPMHFRLVSAVQAGRITAQIDPPTVRPPRAILLRLRHPEDRPIRSVTVNGAVHDAFSRDTITLTGGRDRATVEVGY